jgi:hypothetical protein
MTQGGRYRFWLAAEIEAIRGRCRAGRAWREIAVELDLDVDNVRSAAWNC